MELTHISIKNYKSLKDVTIENPPNPLVLIGKNDVGKSNLLDVFNLIWQGSRSTKTAIRSRGTSLQDLIWRKTPEAEASIVLTFATSPTERKAFLHALPRLDETVEHWILENTAFLAQLSYSLVIARDSFKEVLTTPNTISADGPVLIVSVTGGEEHHNQSCSNPIEAFRSFAPGSRLEFPITASGSGSGSQLALVRSGASSAWEPTVSAVRKVLSGIRWISPIRRSHWSRRVEPLRQVDQESENLAAVLNTLNSNNPDLYQEIETETRRLFPDIGSFMLPMTSDLMVEDYSQAESLGHTHEPVGTTTTFAIRQPGGSSDRRYVMNQLSFGLRSIVAIMTAVLTSEQDSWVCIEEPEAHLHPSAQEGLVDFLLRHTQNRRLFMTTHSPVIAGCIGLSSMFLMRRGETGDSEMATMNEATVSDCIQELGVRPSFNFEADGVLFVEGKGDVPLVQVWLAKAGLAGRVQCIDAGGWTNMAYYANAKILKTRRVPTKVFVLFDGDTERPDAMLTKNRLVRELAVEPNSIFTTQPCEIEGYLFDAGAILRAFPGVTISEADLAADLATRLGRRDLKGQLSQVLENAGCGPYDLDKGVRIARAMNRLPEFFVNVFAQIKAAIG